jgi:hypothetical protein
MRNERAIRNYCEDGKLQTGMMLISWQMPNCQQSPLESEQPNLGPRWLLKREEPPRALETRANTDSRTIFIASRVRK